MSVDLKGLKKVRCRFLNRRSGQPLAHIVATLYAVEQESFLLPVATLRSDATGYMSFDLQPLVAFGIVTADKLLISAPQVGLKGHDLLASIRLQPSNDLQSVPDDKQVRYAAPSSSFAMSTKASGPTASAAGKIESLSIEFPIYAEKIQPDDEKDEVACARGGLPAIQSPDRSDYALSPFSFIAPPRSTSLGGCCETLAPATLPLQEHTFYRVVVRRDQATQEQILSRAVAARSPYGRMPSPGQTIAGAVDVLGQLAIPPPTIKLAQILEYRQRWYSLGHSLGEIKYSLPLAPGESTQMAVIEWSRDDSASRYDKVRGTESLNHDLRRDRSIDESVDAGLQESQSGWSWAGGLSSGMAYDAKAYGQYTGNWAAGGGTSNSSGQRDLKADSTQDLHDHVVQGTSYVRSLTSTVIVQAKQSENNTIQTRRVANHNHCHALTIEYYEVLRQFRLRTEFVRTRRAALIPFSPITTFTSEIALRFRHVLEQVLLDSNLLAFFDALVRLGIGDDAYPKAPTQEPTKPDVSSRYYSGTTKFTVAANAPLDTGLEIEKGSSASISADGSGIKFSGDFDAGSFGPEGTGKPVDDRWPYTLAKHGALLAQIGGDFYTVGAGTTFRAANNGPLRFQFNDPVLQDNSGSASVQITVTAPESTSDSPPSSNEEPASPVRIGDTRESDTVKEGFLIQHLNGNRGFYNRAIWMLMDPIERRLHMEAALGSDSHLLAAIDDKPICVSGNYVGFIYNGSMASDLTAEPDQELDPDPLESIVTLPTRGVFAEAQLGHCNSCEKRDVTRMWDWSEMTTEEPPVISGIEPGPRGQMPNLTPQQLPANIIQITQPQAAPDPTAMANALGVLRTPNIFRDMSGLDQASAILGKLVDGTNKSLDDMLKGASHAKAQVDAERAKTGDGTPTGSSPLQKQTPGERYDNLQVAKELGKAADQLGLTSQQKSQLAQDIIGNLGAATPAVQTASWPPSAMTTSLGPQKLLSGAAATSQAAQLLATAQAVTLPNGGVLRPGTIWNDNAILVSADWTYAYYLKDGDLYEWNTNQFIRDELLTAWQQGVASAATLVVLADAEISLLAGIFVGPASLVAATIVDSGLKLYHNRIQAQAAYRAGWDAASALNCIRTSSPELWAQLEKATFQAIINNAPQDVSLKTVAFWIGRMMRGVGQAAPDVALAGLAFIIVRVTTIVAALHAPGLVGQALDNAIAANVTDLKTAFSAQGVQITTDDAKALLHALNSDDPAMQCVGELKDALDAIRPVLQQLVPQVLQ
jgi:hypothetical protein